MSAATVVPIISEAERLELFAIYLSLPGLHGKTFDEHMAEPIIVLCLRNTLEAKKRALAARAAEAARAVENFELVS